jgi:hypothetical protein
MRQTLTVDSDERMQIVAAKQLQQWLEEGEIIEQDGRGPKVLRMPDARLLKIFRPRRRLWLARLQPQAQHFAENAARLTALGLRTPQIGECLWLDQRLAISACFYQPLPGQSLDRIFRQQRGDFDALLPELAAFISQLHRLGIYFRSLHLGNILRLPDGSFGLIDFLDVHFKRGALNAWQVRRNFQHLQGYLTRSKIDDFPWQRLMQLYKELP